MKKIILIALAAITLGACGTYAEKHPELEGCWNIEKDDFWSSTHEATACNVEIKTERAG